MPSFESYIAPTKKYADIIVPRGLENTVAHRSNHSAPKTQTSTACRANWQCQMMRHPLGNLEWYWHMPCLWGKYPIYSKLQACSLSVNLWAMCPSAIRPCTLTAIPCVLRRESDRMESVQGLASNTTFLFCKNNASHVHLYSTTRVMHDHNMYKNQTAQSINTRTFITNSESGHTL